MEDKHWVEEKIEKFKYFKDLVKDEIITRIDDFEGQELYLSELDYMIFDSINTDGSYTYSTYWSVKLIKTYFEDFEDLVEKYHFESETLVNPFKAPETFIVIMILEQARDIFNSIEVINSDYACEDIVLTKQLIEEIKEGVEKYV